MGKVISQDDLILRRRDWKDNGTGVVFVSGCFDLLHPGHIRLLEQARSLGAVLVVAVQSDASVRKNAASLNDAPAGTPGHPPLRPITPEAERTEILASLAAVDFVVEFNEDAPDAILARLSPDTYVKGGIANADQPDFRADDRPEAAGRIVFVPLEPGYSTSGLIDRMTRLRE